MTAPFFRQVRTGLYMAMYNNNIGPSHWFWIYFGISFATMKEAKCGNSNYLSKMHFSAMLTVQRVVVDTELDRLSAVFE